MRFPSLYILSNAGLRMRTYTLYFSLASKCVIFQHMNGVIECDVKCWCFNPYTMWVLALQMEMGPHKGRGKLWPEENSDQGQSFPLSLCGPISICRANAHIVYGLKHQHFTSHSITPSILNIVLHGHTLLKQHNPSLYLHISTYSWQESKTKKAGVQWLDDWQYYYNYCFVVVIIIIIIIIIISIVLKK